MNVEDFISTIEEEFEDLKPGVLTPDVKFREVMEFNSINAVIIIALVDAEFDVTINAEDLQSSKTINDLFKIIKSRV